MNAAEQRESELIERDMMVHGECWFRLNADGTRTRIDPAAIYVNPPRAILQAKEPTDG